LALSHSLSPSLFLYLSLSLSLSLFLSLSYLSLSLSLPLSLYLSLSLSLARSTDGGSEPVSQLYPLPELWEQKSLWGSGVPLIKVTLSGKRRGEVRGERERVRKSKKE